MGAALAEALQSGEARGQTPPQAPDLPSPQEALDMFGTPFGDSFSSLFLSQMFGPLFPAADGSGGATVFSSIIGFFNAATLAVSCLIFLYSMSAGLLQTAHDGQVLGRQWSSLWAPLRMVFAIGLLIPVPGLGGYNLAQAGVAWVARGSTNVASAVWSASAQIVIGGAGPITADEGRFDTGAIRTMFLNEVCLATVNHQMKAIGSPLQAGYHQAESLPGWMAAAQAYVAGGQAGPLAASHLVTGITGGKTALESPGICGSASAPPLPEYIASLSSESAIQNSQKSAIAARFQQGHLELVNRVRTDLAAIVDSALDEVLDPGESLPNIGAEIAEVAARANEMTRTLNRDLLDMALGADRRGSQARQELLDRIQGSCGTLLEPTACYGEGWIGAGSWYMTLAQISGEMASLTQAAARAESGYYISRVMKENRGLYSQSGLGGTGWFGMVRSNDVASTEGFLTEEETLRIDRRFKEVYDTSMAGFAALGFALGPEQVAQLGEGASADGLFGKIPGLSGMMRSLAIHALDLTAPSRWASDPMIGLTVIGRMLINMAGVIMAGTVLAGLFGGASAAAAFAIPVAVLLATGGMLAFVLPIMPFALWILSVTGYFLLVAEAVVAVNLWAMSHMTLDGAGLSGSIGKRGWIMLLALLLTPVLMVMGLILGMTVFRVASGLVDMGLHYAISGMIGSSPVMMFFGIIAYALVITVFYTILLERSFSLVSEFPSRILKWIGGGVDLGGGSEGQARVTILGTARTVGAAGRRIEAGLGEAASRIHASGGLTASMIRKRLGK